jgi:hypothetical protein
MPAAATAELAFTENREFHRDLQCKQIHLRATRQKSQKLPNIRDCRFSILRDVHRQTDEDFAMSEKRT